MATQRPGSVVACQWLNWLTRLCRAVGQPWSGPYSIFKTIPTGGQELCMVSDARYISSHYFVCVIFFPAGEVLYMTTGMLTGDTDSVFVELQGRSKEDAFRIGNEIAQEITSKSPADVLLKFEKVYFPCVLVTKKRYVGCSFETLTQPPHLDAKGIEMVRRDQVLHFII